MNTKTLIIIGLSILMLILVMYAVNNAKQKEELTSTQGGSTAYNGLIGHLLDGLHISLK